MWKKPFETSSQKSWLRNWFTPLVLNMLIVVVTLILIHALIRENFYEHFKETYILIQYKIIDINSSITLLVGLLGLWVVRHQLSMGFRPYLGYTSFHSKTSNFSLPNDANEELWVVTIINEGTGLAIINRCSYRMSLKGEQPQDYEYTYCEMIEQLEKKNFIQGRDYILVQISKGASLGPHSEQRVFEMPIDKAMEFSAIDIKIDFEGLMGDRFTKEIFCIPRMGIIKNFHNMIHLGS